MTDRQSSIGIRLLPVILLTTAAIFYTNWARDDGNYFWQNLLPIFFVNVLAAVTLIRGNGSWTDNGWRWPLGTIGFALPAIGLSLYLHHGFSIDMDGMVSQSEYPLELFHYLPIYTSMAGAIGFAIGWIIGRNV